MTMNFDRVVIFDAGRRQTYSAEQFLELPLDRRIKHILAREIEFFDGEMRIDRADALRSLRPGGQGRSIIA